VYSEEYVVARRALLDALEALAEHRDALVLVDAQAVYLHTGAAQFAVAESTTDGDVVIDPRMLGRDPEIASAMRGARFFLDEWTASSWSASGPRCARSAGCRRR